MAKHMIMQTMLHYISGLKFFVAKDIGKIQMGSSTMEAPAANGIG